LDEERFIRAVALRDAGKEEDALREFESLGSQASDEREKSNLLANKANCLWRMRRLTEARQRWSEATITETTPVTELLDAWLCLSEGKDEEAVQKLTLFVRNHVDLKQSACKGLYADAQDELGKLLFGLGATRKQSIP
jgi:tetratricopeptide (TPR) repeat protein